MADERVLTISKDAVPDGGAKVVPIDDLDRVAVFRWGEEFFAINNRCPHASASLAGGPFDGTIVECPLHGYRVNVRTGQCLNSAFRRQKTYRVEVAGDELRITVG